MSATSTDLISETERYLFAGQRDPMNKLATALGAGDTDATFTYDLGAIAAGAYISIDLEIMLVWEVTTAATRTVAIERGVLGSTPADHAAGAVATVNPKFPKFAILDAINADLSDLSAPHNGLFKELSVTLRYNPAIMGYDLTGVTDILEVLEVKYDSTGPQHEWPTLRYWELRRQSDPGDFPSGLALVLYEEAQPGRDVRISYSAPYSLFTDLGENIAGTTGLQPTCNDIPPLGAALRLESMRETQRNFNESQGDSRRATEVPVGAQLAGVRGPASIRQSRIVAERTRLRKKWPYRRKY